jgi:probable addiction module antidote protein
VGWIAAQNAFNFFCILAGVCESRLSAVSWIISKIDNAADAAIKLRMARAEDLDEAATLDSPTAIAAYLSKALGTGDGVIIAKAFGAVAHAKKISSVAKETGLNRENLYRSLKGCRHLALGTILKLLNAFDVELDVRPKEKRQKCSYAARPLHKRRRFRRR